MENEVLRTFYHLRVSDMHIYATETRLAEGEDDFDVKYESDAKFINDWKEGELHFSELATIPVEDVFRKVTDRKVSTNVEALLKSNIFSTELNEVGDEEVSLEVKSGDYIQMKLDGQIRKIHVTDYEHYRGLGWVATKRDYKNYPIVVDPTSYKIQFTIYPEEIQKYLNQNYMVLNQ